MVNDKILYVPTYGSFGNARNAGGNYTLSPGNSTKKWVITTPSGKRVSFGAVGYSDFTFHGEESRKQNYIDRHSTREDWTQTGLETAGFWSKHLLWNKPTLRESIKDIENKFNITINISGDIDAREKYLNNEITH